MIIVDTNVISEVVRSGRDPSVVAWLDAQIIESLFFTAVSLSELRLGIEMLPAGKRKDALSGDVAAIISNFFAGRVLSFDREAAIVYGAQVSAARSAGKAVSVTDGQIGAIASVHGFLVATRDTKPFEAIGVAVINPWKL